MKEVLIVSIGSFFGGGLRYWISKMVQSCSLIAFPFGTMTVNVWAASSSDFSPAFRGMAADG